MAFFTNFKRSAQELKSVKCIVTIGMLLAVAVVLDGFGTIRIGDAIKINFVFLPLSMIGILFGPVCGGLAGMLVDVIGYLVNPIGTFIPWLMLISGLEGLIYGMVLYNIKPEKNWQTLVRIVIARFIVCAICNLTLNTLALYNMGFITGDSFGVLFTARIITNLITFGLGSAMMSVLCIPLKLAYNRIFRKNQNAKETP